MRYRMLGPLRVGAGSTWLEIRAPQQRVVLAVLLAEAGRMVSTERLIDEIWRDRRPRAARHTVQNYVLRLRALLGADRLVTRGRGYSLAVGAGDLDATEFERLARDGRRALTGGDPDAAVARLSEGLALWQGAAFADVPASSTVSAEATRLEQARLGALEDLLTAQLELGRHADVVDELYGLVERHALREQLWLCLMHALHRCGRRGEALEVYRRVRRILVGELGLEPGPELRQLQRTILEEDPRGGARVTPAQLPPRVSGFTGRDRDLRRLATLADDTAGPVIATIAGMAGVGKTALAVHFAHAVRESYPDGQLFVDLCGYACGPPLRPAEALGTVLRALGVPDREIPGEVPAAAALYRSIFAGKRVLVLLDNARDADQVRPLLPGGAGCLVLVTSRNRLGGLVAVDGAVPLIVDELTPADAELLLTRLLGAERIMAERRAVRDLAHLCGHLPLAMRIAAANLAARPLSRIADHVERLAQGDRLAALHVEGDPTVSVKAAFDQSYAAESVAARRLFRLLGLARGPDFTPTEAAALAGLPVKQASGLLHRLVSTHLVNERAPGRYGLPDLLRLYARQLE